MKTFLGFPGCSQREISEEKEWDRCKVSALKIEEGAMSQGMWVASESQ